MEFLTVKETAQLLRVSPITVRRYIASGQLAAERVGRGIRVRREAIEAFITPLVPISRREANSERPCTILEGLGVSVGSGRSAEPTNIAEHKHEDLPDAFADLQDPHDSEFAEPIPRPFTMDDPLWGVFGSGEADDLDNPESDDELPTLREQLGNIIGIGRSGRPSDISANKYKYIAEAYESNRG